MKKSFLLFVVAAAVSAPAFALSQTLFHQNFVNLKTEASSVSMTIDYPGKISNTCGLKINPSLMTIKPGAIEVLQSQLVVHEGFQAPGAELNSRIDTDKRTIDYDIQSRDTFLTNVTISTVSGDSLSDVVQGALGGDESASAIVVSTPCP